MEHNNTNWQQSVTGVVIREGKVLLARHTYGPGKGRLIIPGGYAQEGETPEDALRREFLEETKVAVEPRRVIGSRFDAQDGYVALAADYISGTARSDQDENDLVVWLDVAEALAREDVPDLTKKLIQAVQASEGGFPLVPYESRVRSGPGTLYCAIPKEAEHGA